ncbi:hypothetical protein E0L29_10680 [Chlorobium sp. N1]|nr:hypothetical protein E0L29_10680 [Chlorobium sp. N1]
MVFGKVVELERIDKDRYGRSIGWVTVNGRSLNRELLIGYLACPVGKRSAKQADLAVV